MFSCLIFIGYDFYEALDICRNRLIWFLLFFVLTHPPRDWTLQHSFLMSFFLWLRILIKNNYFWQQKSGRWQERGKNWRHLYFLFCCCFFFLISSICEKTSYKTNTMQGVKKKKSVKVYEKILPNSMCAMQNNSTSIGAKPLPPSDFRHYSLSYKHRGYRKYFSQGCI